MCPQIVPGEVLSSAKSETKEKSQRQPTDGLACLRRFEPGSGRKRTAGDFKRYTAEQEKERIEIKDRREGQMTPIGCAFPNEESARKSGERHGDGKDGDPDAAAGSTIRTGQSRF